MKLIVGLGNPGLRYRNTRHNIGFKAIKLLAKKHKIKINKNEFGAKCGHGAVNNHKVILAMPQKFMNLSGGPLKALADYYRIKREDLLVVSDDVNIMFGALRLRREGSAGGHKGLKSVIENLGGADFARLRIGVGKEGLRGDITEFVLGEFTKEERQALPEVVQEAAANCENWIECKAERRVKDDQKL